jgi:hypothetical protein
VVPLEGLFEGFDDRDRLGVVVRSPCGAVGASALITATITAFYDIQRRSAQDFFIYPDYFLFHVGRPLGDHGMLDVWPAHKEVVVPEDPDRLLEAINDRGVTRLVVEDGTPDGPELDPGAVASAQGRIADCLAYSPSGRVREADVRMVSNPVTEGYVRDVLEPERRLEELRASGDRPALYAAADRAAEVEPDVRARIAEARAELLEDGVPVETYRRIGLDEALALLAPQRAAVA